METGVWILLSTGVKQLHSRTLLPELPESELELNHVDSLMHSRKNQLYLHRSILFFIAKKFSSSDSTVRSVSKSEKTDQIPSNGKREEHRSLYYSDNLRSWRCSEKMQHPPTWRRRKRYTFTNSVRIRHIMIYKAVQQHCHIHLKIIL